jgi:16S rRNA (cytosine1402-N4)-methyltransferase
VLAPGGRLCVISFHSLEDRIVKQKFSAWAKGCICPPDFPVCVCGRKPMAKIISGRGITAAKEELSENRRSRSAKLRVCERTEEEYREEL